MVHVSRALFWDDIVDFFKPPPPYETVIAYVKNEHATKSIYVEGFNCDDELFYANANGNGATLKPNEVESFQCSCRKGQGDNCRIVYAEAKRAATDWISVLLNDSYYTVKNGKRLTVKDVRRELREGEEGPAANEAFTLEDVDPTHITNLRGANLN